MLTRKNSGIRFLRPFGAGVLMAGMAGSALLASCVVGVFAAPTAIAVSAACGTIPNAYIVADGVCEITFTVRDDQTWTPPQGTTQLDALLVGGGGGGFQTAISNNFYAYAGGGGDVQAVSLNPANDVTIDVGGGGVGDDYDGADSSVTQASTTTTAAGGISGTQASGGGASGSGFAPLNGSNTDASETGYFGSGGGAGAAAPDSNGGDGLNVAALASATGTYFDDYDVCLGGGGGIAYAYEGWSIAEWSYENCGGGFAAIQLDSGLYSTSIIGDPVPNSGGGGEAYYIHPGSPASDVIGDAAGADGVVILRFNDPSGTLPNTAATSQSIATTGTVLGLSALLVGTLATSAVALRRRLRTS